MFGSGPVSLLYCQSGGPARDHHWPSSCGDEEEHDLQNHRDNVGSELVSQPESRILLLLLNLVLQRPILLGFPGPLQPFLFR